MADEAQIGEAGRRLAHAAPDARVLLFGSHARASGVLLLCPLWANYVRGQVLNASGAVHRG